MSLRVPAGLGIAACRRALYPLTCKDRGTAAADRRHSSPHLHLSAFASIGARVDDLTSGETCGGIHVAGSLLLDRAINWIVPSTRFFREAGRLSFRHAHGVCISRSSGRPVNKHLRARLPESKLRAVARTVYANAARGDDLGSAWPGSFRNPAVSGPPAAGSTLSCHVSPRHVAG